MSSDSFMVLKLRDPEPQVYYNFMDIATRAVFIKSLDLPIRFGAEIYVDDDTPPSHQFVITKRDKNVTVVYRTLQIEIVMDKRGKDVCAWINDRQLKKISKWIKEMNLEEEPVRYEWAGKDAY